MTKKKYRQLIGKHGESEVGNNMIFPVKLSSKKQKEADAALSAELAKRRASMSEEEKLRGSLLQLRFQAEDAQI